MSWLVTFGKSSEKSSRKIAFVISREHTFAKILMQPSDWTKPNDPNRDPFNKALYPQDLTDNQLFGILTANLQLHFDEITELETEQAVKELVESVIGKLSGVAGSKSSENVDQVNVSIGQKFVELARLFEKLEATQNQEIDALKVQIAKLHDELVVMRSVEKSKVSAVKASKGKTSSKLASQTPKKTSTKKSSSNSKVNRSRKK